MKLDLLRNALANLAGGAVPAVVTLLTLPFIVREMGADSYGVLVLITSIIGYFSVLDLNVTAGSVKYVAEHHARGDVRTRNQTIVCGLGIYAAIGVVGGLAVLLFNKPLINNVFQVPESLRPEAGDALRLAALGFLFGQVQIYLQSVPQAIRRYDWTAAVESAFGVVVPLATVAVLWLGHGLLEVVQVRVVAGAVNAALLGLLLHRLLPDFRFEKPARPVLAALGRFSGYAYLSRLAMVAYTQGDKLIIGALVTMGALALYAVPFMLVNRLYALTYRLGAVLFPVASALHAAREPQRLKEIYLYGLRYTLFINSALAALLATLAHEVLHYWMGAEVAASGMTVLAILAFAALLDSVTNVPSLVNDGLGHPRITGLFALARAGLGLLLTFLLVAGFGVIGAAWAQLATAAVMPTLFLWYIHGRTVPASWAEMMRVAVLPALPVVVAAACLVFARGGAEVLQPAAAVALILAEGLAIGAYGLFFVFRQVDRIALVARLQRKRAAG